MEKPRSFSWKPTRFLVLSLSLSFSFVLLSFFSFWAVRSPSAIHHQSFLLLNTPSLSLTLTPLNLQSLTSPFTDSSAYSVNTTNLTDTHFTKPHNSSAAVVDEVNGEDFSDLRANFSVGGVKDSSLGDANLRKPYYSPRFVNSSISKGYELHRKGNIEEFHKANASGLVESSNSKEEEFHREGDAGKVGKVGKVASGGTKDDSETRSKETEPNVSSIGKETEKERVKSCDVSEGRWVFDDSYPLYTNFSCPFIDEGFNCQGNGRRDTDYMKWRWQPQDCDTPRFNATNMLELIRGKRLVFVGDSINRNQWESLLCLLMGAVKDSSKVYETHGRKITKEKGIYSFRFVDYQCTVEFYVTHFLVHETKARIGRKRKETLRIDSIDKGSSRWRGADILIFNTGNWWSHFKTKAGVNYYQEGKQVYAHLDALTAYGKALTTWATWVDRHVNRLRTHVFFRSTAPAHFRGGQWNTGGHCREARKPLDEMHIDHPEKDLITLEVIRKMKTSVIFLNITGLSSYRIDGHPSKYGKTPGKRGSSAEDCSHWCLPGVPDAWNELIYHQLLLKQRKSAQVS